MEITRENLIKEGFTEKKCQNLSFYTKGNFGIVHNFNLWLLCNCETDIPLINKTYVSTMEEVQKCLKEYEEMNGK